MNNKLIKPERKTESAHTPFNFAKAQNQIEKATGSPLAGMARRKSSGGSSTYSD